jgi:hypothetical protein
MDNRSVAIATPSWSGMARWTIQRRCCSRHPLMGVRVADFPGIVYVFTMTDPRVHDPDLRVHDG